MNTISKAGEVTISYRMQICLNKKFLCEKYLCHH